MSNSNLNGAHGFKIGEADMSQNNHNYQGQTVYRNRYEDGAQHQQGSVSGGVGHFSFDASPRPESRTVHSDPLPRPNHDSRANSPRRLDSGAHSPPSPKVPQAQVPLASSFNVPAAALTGLGYETLLKFFVFGLALLVLERLAPHIVALLAYL